MYQFLTKHGQLGAFGLGFVVIAIFVFSVSSGIDAFDALPEEDQGNSTVFDLGIKMTIVLFVICAGAALLFALYDVATNPKAAIKGIISFIVLGVLFAILYNTSEVETSGPVAASVEKFGLTDNASKLVSAGIKSTLILAGIAVAAFVISEVRNLFK